MMKANELRIGNWINDVSEGISQIGCIDTRSQNVGLINPLGGSHDGTMLEFIQPILLTKEWLLKLGFTKKFYSYYELNDISLFLRNTGGVFELLGSDTDVLKSVEIKYVHQLQNLYFALTGEELQYNG